MTTYAPTFTPRWKGTYVCAGVQHTIQGRGARGTSFADMDFFASPAAAIFDAVHTFLPTDYAWVKAEIALTDSDVFLPATTPTVTTPGTQNVADYSPMDKISAIALSGKSSGGRARFFMYGLLLLGSTPGDIGEDGLVDASEVAGLTTIITTAHTYFRATDGLQATYHNRATYKANDHLLKLVRRGIIS